ncbi:MAG: hypothetical protein KC584_08975, partial [Nitrospira sp.]|nr:hypothetical protein [Nitrospira sp.]
FVSHKLWRIERLPVFVDHFLDGPSTACIALNGFVVCGSDAGVCTPTRLFLLVHFRLLAIGQGI